MKALFIDNNDLSTHSLLEEFKKQGCDVMTYRNNVDMKIIDNTVKKFKPGLIVITPGGGSVAQSGNSLSVIRTYYGKIPLFGVGLGMQCIVEAFDGHVDRAPYLMHGKTCRVNHDNKSIFKKISQSFLAGRYNSLTPSKVPFSLEVSARDENDMVMGIRHKEAFAEGIQFHPESILTPLGSKLIENVIQEGKKK